MSDLDKIQYCELRICLENCEKLLLKMQNSLGNFWQSVIIENDNMNSLKTKQGLRNDALTGMISLSEQMIETCKKIRKEESKND